KIFNEKVTENEYPKRDPYKSNSESIISPANTFASNTVVHTISPKENNLMDSVSAIANTPTVENNAETPVIAQQPTVTITPEATPKAPKKSIEELLTQENLVLAQNEPERGNNKGVQFGVFAGTYMNYARG